VAVVIIIRKQSRRIPKFEKHTSWRRVGKYLTNNFGNRGGTVRAEGGRDDCIE
jgi:hypothetical protein